MTRDKIDFSKRAKLQYFVDQIARSVTDRWTQFSVQAHSEDVCTVIITVSGQRGIASRTLVCMRVDMDGVDKWHVLVNANRYICNTMSEIGTAIKYQQTHMKNLLLKF